MYIHKATLIIFLLLGCEFICRYTFNSLNPIVWTVHKSARL